MIIQCSSIVDIPKVFRVLIYIYSSIFLVTMARPKEKLSQTFLGKQTAAADKLKKSQSDRLINEIGRYEIALFILSWQVVFDAGWKEILIWLSVMYFLVFTLRKAIGDLITFRRFFYCLKSYCPWPSIIRHNHIHICWNCLIPCQVVFIFHTNLTNIF